jgi:hypothetical protein
VPMPVPGLPVPVPVPVPPEPPDPESAANNTLEETVASVPPALGAASAEAATNAVAARPAKT